MIPNFRNKYSFLSNFYEVEIEYRGIVYKTSEHAYQALKATNKEDFRLIKEQTSARMAKKYGNAIEVRKDWEEVRFNLMLEIVREKFKNPYLKKKLSDTEDEYILEGNKHHDQNWGDCICGREKCKEKGKNWLGVILMKVREENK